VIKYSNMWEKNKNSVEAVSSNPIYLLAVLLAFRCALFSSNLHAP
jgi:hypothetical protein